MYAQKFWKTSDHMLVTVDEKMILYVIAKDKLPIVRGPEQIDAQLGQLHNP